MELDLLGQDTDEEAKLFLEKLTSLGEVKDHQHSLQQMRGKLERHYMDYVDCQQLAAHCSTELTKLQDERSHLQSRLEEIDAHITQLTDLKRDLDTMCASSAESAPTELFQKLEEQVNEERGALGMDRLPTYEVLSKLSSHTSVSTPTRKNSRSRDHPYSCPTSKAGPSYKHCPKCDFQVSRNAVKCSNCNFLCSRPGHSTGKKKPKS